MLAAVRSVLALIPLEAEADHPHIVRTLYADAIRWLQASRIWVDIFERAQQIQLLIVARNLLGLKSTELR